MFKRQIQSDVEKALFNGKVVILYGARQVGKTTLVKEIQKNIEDSVYFNCDEPYVRKALTNKSSKELCDFVGKRKLVILDEAQRVENIGITLKLLIDNYPEIQIIATGSSSFELANKIVEPLTGRKVEFYLYPLSVEEMLQNTQKQEFNHSVTTKLIFGSYPAVITCENDNESTIKEIAHSYVYKDILNFNNIRNPESLEKLLQALALQVGSEVSYNELASTVGIDKETVRDYIRILEQAFIIFRLRPFHKNLRAELKKLRKIYFFDNGLRNAIINNFNPVELRNDVGELWENFLIAERFKYLSNNKKDKQMFFWRTRKQQEIDYLEVEAEMINAFEFKWNSDKIHIPKAFREAYNNVDVKLINNKNYLEFVTNNNEKQRSTIK
jgi:predicted AAA+ superfamily ATPase